MISVVIPVLNEEENIPLLVENIFTALKEFDFEIIFVDDGSKDNSVEVIKSFVNKQVHLIVFYKNFGQSSAMKAGIQSAKGEYIVTMDGDLQNDATDIPAMFQLLQEKKADIVAGIRKKRKDNSLRKIPSKIANAIIRLTTGEKVKDNGCSLRIYKSRVAKNLDLYGELHRFIYILAKMQGAKIEEMEVKHQARIHGKSKYGLGRTFRVISDLMLIIFFKKYFQKPIHLFGGLGLALFSAGMIINLYFLYEKIMGMDIWGRPLLLLGIIMTLGGIQLITTGFIAEIVMRTYFESQNKSTYEIKEEFFEDKEVEAQPVAKVDI